MKFNISYQGKNFKERFVIDSVKPKKIEPQFKTIKKNMWDREILAELKPEEISINELAYILDKNLIEKTNWFIFYIKDKSNITHAVHVSWRGGNGWFVYALGLDDGYQWSAGGQVVSCKFLGNSDSSQTLENSNALTLALKNLEVLEKIIKDTRGLLTGL